MANKTLVQKLNEVSKDIGYLQKDKKNKMQNYSYLSEAKIKEVFKKEFEKNGILFNYSTDEVREYEISPTSRGTKQFCTIAKGTYRLMDVDSDQEIVGTWHGSGTDTGDKGLYKAITGGIKYVLNTNFLIPSGDDPENDGKGENGGSGETGNKPEPPKLKNSKATQKQTEKMWAMVKEAEADEDKFKKWIYENYNIKSTKDLLSKDMDAIYEVLDAKITEKNFNKQQKETA